MAAESILSALLPVIQDKLISPAIVQLGVVFGTKEKLKKLERNFEIIQSVIVDAEERQTANDHIKIWLSDLKDLAYKAEDLLEDFEFEAHEKGLLLNHSSLIRKVLYYCFFCKPSITHFSLCQRLNDIIEKIEKIADEIKKFNFQPNRVPQISNYSRPQTHSYVDKETVIGREKDKEDIVSFLISDDVIKNKNNIVVLPIVAMGGMGKTTLCQLVCQDNRVKSHFQANRIWWVCVSDADFDLARLARLIVEAATKGECKLENMELLQQRLREIISGKRCLIVLDDVWNEDTDKWNRLKTLLDCGGEGSAVVVSTRSTIAAKMMATHTDTIHYLKQLPEEDCWELFRRRAFGEGAEQPENLVKIGEDIIKRCEGLPLAINTLGSLLQSFQNDEEKWKAVLDSAEWKMKAAKDILPALRLSYNYLRPHLKQCFAFCAIYPKDYEMEKEELIQLWMANGYIPSSDGSRDSDDEGRDIFDELVSRSFFQNVEEHDVCVQEFGRNLGYHGHVTCKMHDLMHDLARSIMGKECVNFEDTPKCEDIPSTVRHLRIPAHPESIIPPNIRTAALISSWHYFHHKSQFLKYLSMLSMLKPLRVLRVSSLAFNIDLNISQLRHMRLLDLSSTFIKELPEGICSLYNLQTLNLSNCWELKKLPQNFTNLVNLRHLYTNGCTRLVCMPRGMGRLKQLHTLTKYIVSAEAESGIEQLRDLNLGGELEIDGIEKVSNAIDAEGASLSSKQNLSSITLSWRGAGSPEVFEALEPHNGLRMLKVQGYEGQQFPTWMNNRQQLQNLVRIKLRFCSQCEDLPLLGQLPLLEFLHLSNMHEVKHIISKTTWCNRELNTKLFPSLKELEMSGMENLEDWWEAEGSNAQVLPDRQQIFPCLTELSINDCKKLTTIPAIPSLQDLTLDSCNPNLTTNIFSFTTYNGPGFQLQTLTVSNCEVLVHLPACLPSTRILEIEGCNSLESLPGPGGLTKLQQLQLWICDGLVSLPRGMGALTHLHILNCKRLTSLPEDLTKLQELKLRECDDLVSLPRGMEALTHLDIRNCKRLTSLSEDLTKLQELKLRECGDLVSLPRGMEALTNLRIKNCERLMSLPEDLTKLDSLFLYGCNGLVSLPQGIEGITKLHISDCNGLKPY